MDPLIAYDTMVAGLSARKSADFISNRCSDHAAILIKHLFRSASDTVLVFTSRLSRSVYCRREIVVAAREFLARGGRLQIVIQSLQSEEALTVNDFMKALDPDCGWDSATSRLAVYVGNESVVNLKHHFCVADRIAFRFEKDINTHEAFASFNDPEVGDKLSGLFSSLLENSVQGIAS